MGDSDTDDPPAKKAKVVDGGGALPECPYGSRCYRKNPLHFKEYSHPPKDSDGASPSTSKTSQIDMSKLPPCKYGANCYRKNLLHYAEFSHPFQGGGATATPGSDSEDTDVYDSDEDTKKDKKDDDKKDKKKALTVKATLKHMPTLSKNYSQMTEQERRDLIKNAFEAKKKLEEELKETKKKMEEKEKELEKLQQQVNTGLLVMEGELEALKGTKVVYFPLIAERAYKEGSAAQVHFRLAESQFYRLLTGDGGEYRVTKVEYVINPELVQRFKGAQKGLKKERGEDLSYPVLAFHGTQEKNIIPICETGFKIPGESGFKHRTDTGWYGKGVYFSEFPSYSMGYIQGSKKLLLCQVLPGKVYKCTKLIHGNPLIKGYDSHTSPDKKELVIFNSHHILPSYIVHYTAANTVFKYKTAAAAKKKKVPTATLR